MQVMPMPGMVPPMQPQARNMANGPVLPNSTLYVGNLDSDLDEQRLYEHFSQYGPVNNVRIMRDIYSGDSRGFAFVNYSNPTDAKRAKLTLNHTKIQDNAIRISFKRNPSEIDTKANLYISNLDSKMNSRELEDTCKEYGNIVSCVVREDGYGQSLGYGYVQFETEAEAQLCLTGINGTKYFEKEITVQLFVPRAKRPGSTKNNLYLKGFPSSYSEETIKQFIEKSFGEFGATESVGVVHDKKVGKYYGFVAFKNSEEARNAVTNLNNHEFETGDKLYVDYAQQKT
jgi:polyadenylate-binding protein